MRTRCYIRKLVGCGKGSAVQTEGIVVSSPAWYAFEILDAARLPGTGECVFDGKCNIGWYGAAARIGDGYRLHW